MKTRSLILGALKPSQSPVVRNSISLLISTGGTSVLGVLFWSVATHLYSVATVGRGSVQVSSMALIANFAQLNLSSAFIRFLPRAGIRTRTTMIVSYLGCSILALVSAIIFLLSPLRNGIVPFTLSVEIAFAASIIFWTIFVIQDAALIALQSTKWVPVENILFGAVKLGLLPILLGTPSGEGVFYSWTIPVVAAILIVNGFLFLSVVPKRIASASKLPIPPLPKPRALMSFISAEYLSGLVGTSAAFLMPLIIIKRLGPQAAGYFYLPWLVGTSFSSLLWSIASPTIAEAAHDRMSLHDILRKSLKLYAIFVIPASLCVVLGAPILLTLLSQRYAAHGTTLLRLIGLSFPFSAAISMYNASLWIKKRIWVLLGIRTLSSVGLLVLTWVLLSTLGVSAAGVAELTIYGVIALSVLPIWLKWYRSIQPNEVRLAIDRYGKEDS
ncbi:MAG: hypothetical protein HKL84_05285 [Acidimicrobiaceae bacterium]|nr:hypothetical protein [Acidimicrobiaceae bacterium]